MKLRFIDAGTVSGLRSQSIYHGLGYAQTPDTHNTIVLATPETPYMCIGFFQDLENELDIDYCRASQLPVIRRETGGGAVYIDKGQLFVQWVFQQRSLPRRVDHRFQLFVKPLIETYKFFGINAYYYPTNDVHVDGKKIVGTGAATIGNGEVVTGNFLFDFDHQTMIDAINVPDKQFREAVKRNLPEFLTTMKRELKNTPERSEVIEVYKVKCEEELGLKSEPGIFTDKELKQMELIEQKFRQSDWLYQTKRPKPKDKIFKVHLGVWVGRTSSKVKQGEITSLITMRDNQITDISLKTIGFKLSDYSLLDLETELIGAQMDYEILSQKIKLIARNLQPEWTDCIYRVKELQMQQTGNGSLARNN